jgi:hypothetical protein
VVDSERVRAEVLRNNPATGWPVAGVTIEAGGTIHLASIDATFPLAEVYAGTHLA